MDEWVDGWMGGWVDGWVAGFIDDNLEDLIAAWFLQLLVKICNFKLISH